MKNLVIDFRFLAGALVAVLAVSMVSASPRVPSLETAGDGSISAPLLVTSSLGATSAVLFVLDPNSRTLTAYEAVPGEEGGLSLLGARKIDHDLRLTQYRDQSEFSYGELRDQYQRGAGDRDDDSR